MPERVPRRKNSLRSETKTTGRFLPYRSFIGFDEQVIVFLIADGRRDFNRLTAPAGGLNDSGRAPRTHGVCQGPRAVSACAFVSAPGEGLRVRQAT
jgi:hypothetical protein